MFLIVSQSVSQTEHSRGPLGDPSARVFEMFLIVSQSVSQSVSQTEGGQVSSENSHLLWYRFVTERGGRGLPIGCCLCVS